MPGFVDFLGAVLRVLVSLMLALALGIFVMLLLVVFVLGGLAVWLWWVLTGRGKRFPVVMLLSKYVPQVVQQYKRRVRPGWRPRARAKGEPSGPAVNEGARDDVVDVQAHEVDEKAPREPGDGGRSNAPPRFLP